MCLDARVRQKLFGGKTICTSKVARETWEFQYSPSLNVKYIAIPVATY